MDMENFRTIVGKRNPKGGFQTRENSVTQKVIRALPVMGDNADVPTLSEIAQKANVPKDKARRALATLTNKKYHEDRGRHIAVLFGFDEQVSENRYAINPQSKEAQARTGTAPSQPSQVAEETEETEQEQGQEQGEQESE